MAKRKNEKQIHMNFNVVQTHNKADCEPHHEGGRYGMIRRVDKRIGYILTVFLQTPTGFSSLGPVVERINKLHKGANYRYGDIYPTVLRMKEVGLIRQTASGWSVPSDAREKFAKFDKNLRGL